MGGSGVCGAGGGVGRMFHEPVGRDTGCSGVDWFPMAILGGRAGGADSVFTLGGRAGVCNGDGGGTGAVGRWASTLGASEGFSLGEGWMWCSGGGRKMLRMRVRSSNRLVCSVSGTSLMVHARKWRAWTMRSSGLTLGCVMYEW